MNRIFRCTLFFMLVILASCRVRNTRLPDKNPILSALEIYYGVSYDTLEKYYYFNDSGEVKTTGLKFYHFFDIRDTFSNKDYWVEGVIAMNTITNNNYIFSTKYKGDNIRRSNTRYRSDTKYSHEKVWHNDIDYPLYEDTFLLKKRCDTIDVFTERNTGVALKLSSLLNDLPVYIKAKMTRPVMDSLIQLFLFTRTYDKIIGGGYHPSGFVYFTKVNDSDDFQLHMSMIISLHTQNGVLLHKREKDKASIINSLQSLKKYLHTVESNLDKQNVFFYSNRSELLFNDGLIMVKINDGLPDNLSRQDYYSIFCQEPIMYDVKIYSENF